jgi:DNA polymerase-1
MAMFPQFREIWLVDFEFEFGGSHEQGELPRPLCLVAREFRSGRIVRQWRSEFGHQPPYPTDPGVLFVAYYASAELGCHLALGWPMPGRILDLYVEHRARYNGRSAGFGNSLVGALAAHGLDSIGAAEKDEMRDLILGGGPWTPEERRAIGDYCQSDVDSLARLLPVMAAHIDLPRALLRGRYMAAAARMERTGIPVDVETLEWLRAHWHEIQDALIATVDADYDVFEGRSFKTQRWGQWLERNGIPWPRLDSGALDLSEDTFREMARLYPAVSPVRELRHALSQLRLNDLAVGSDGRNRTLLSAFQARTGRNQPSNSRSIFGPSVWLRGLIQPKPGTAVAYVDWGQQEFGIAAALSEDPMMLEAYSSGDPYLEFAKQAGAVPPRATKYTHGAERELFKACALAVQYGMGDKSLAYRIGRPPIEARELLRKHRETYWRFWEWSDRIVTHAMLLNRIHTVFGWPLHVSHDPNERSLRNFPMQANGAEMLRLACCLAIERGVRVCMPVHDAILIEAYATRIDEMIEATQAAMAEASRVVLDGFELRSDVKIIRQHERYSDARGATMWSRVMSLLAEAECRTPCGVNRVPRAARTPRPILYKGIKKYDYRYR